MKICTNKRDFMEALGVELNSFGIADKTEILNDFEQHFEAGIAGGQTEQEVCEKLGDITEIARQYVDEGIVAEPSAIIVPAIPAPEPKNDGFDTNAQEVKFTEANANTANPQNNQNNQNAQNGQNNQNNQNNQNGNNFNNNGFNNNNNGNFNNNNNFNNNGYNNNFNNNRNGNFNNNYNNNAYYQPANSGRPSAGGIVAAIIVDLFVLTWALPTLISLIIGFAAAAIGMVVAGVGGIIFSAISFAGTVPFFSTVFSPLTGIFAGIVILAIGGLFVLLAIVMIKGFVGLMKGIISWHSQVITGHPINWKTQNSSYDFSNNQCAFNGGNHSGGQR